MLSENVLLVIQDLYSKVAIVIVLQLTNFIQHPLTHVKVNLCLFPSSYFLQNCPNTCSKCESAEKCTECQPGFALQNGKCEACPTGEYVSGQTCQGIGILLLLLMD